jgi:acyl transferase domain-containing protein/phosphopantetheinyl transferase
VTEELRGNGVAIIGMSCLFPGARDVDAYWRNILNKVDAVSDPPPEAWDADVYYDAEFTDADKVYCKRGGYLGSLVSFDPLAHRIPPISVGGEPDQWLALQIAHDALADAGCLDLPPEVRARTGVILGKGTYLNGGNAIAVQRGLIVEQTVDVIRRLHPEHSAEQLGQLRLEMKRALPSIGPETVPGLIPNIVVGRIANRLDLMGPTYTVDAACASSLVAVQLAMRHLVDGDCDLALAGGSQVWMPVPTLNLFCQLGALSRREQIRPFDKDADGTLLGEGIGMVVLKRAADARRDGDRMYAVIRSVGVASDGRGASVMAPRVEGEELALRRAYEEAGLSPRSVGLVEAHGTATAVGDVAEVQALTRVFGERDEVLPRCALGTVKSMISHTIPASGVAGLIKLALALHHRVLPPTLNCREPNPKLELDKTPFYINTETRPWIHGGPEPRRAAINAFGFGGINAHAILEEVDEATSVSIADHLPRWDSEVCIFEAGGVAGLIQQARRLLDALAGEPADCDLTDVSFTLSQRLGRSERPLRLAVVATSFADLKAKLEKALSRLEPETRRLKGISGIYFEAEPLGRRGKVVFVFPGEGAQYANMLADLCLYFPKVREAFDQVDRIYYGHPRGHLSSDWIFPRPAFSDAERRLAEQRLVQMDIAVEAVLAANQAVHALLAGLGLRADACVGHSTGEFSAAKAAGVLQIDDVKSRAAFSDQLYRCYSDAASRDDLRRAVLLAVGGGREQVEAIAREAGGDIVVAMDNCPHQVVLVGEPAAAARARQILERECLIYEQLPYDRAVHTPQFAPFAQSLREVFARVDIGTPRTPLYSCTTGGRYPDDAAEIRELLVDHWTSPVEFRRTIEGLYEHGARVFVECGPRGNLTAFIDDILRGREFCAVAADVPRRSGITQLNHLVAMLAAHDVGLDFSALYARRCPREIAWADLSDTSVTVDAGARVSLATSWPMLHLAQSAIDKFRSMETPRTGWPSLTENAANGHRVVEPAVVDGAAEVVVGEIVDFPGNRSPLASRDDDVALAMDAHLGTMDRFLAAQEDIMQAYLATEEPVLHPLLGILSSSTPGVELVFRRVLDPNEDVYLEDHRLGGALAVMPLTMSLAILAEAAAQVAPALHVTGLREVRARRWLMVGSDPQPIEVIARRTPDRDGVVRVRAELHNLSEAVGPGPRSPVVDATVLLADAYPDAPAPIMVCPESRPSGWDPQRLYKDAMFHGPRWQGVRGVEATDPQGVRARLEVLPLAGFLRSTEVPPLPLDPVVLDAAGQVIGFWTAEHLERGQVVFPFRLRALDVYGPQRPVGEGLTCAAEIRLIGDHLVSSDIDVLAPGGRPWMRLRGWEDKRFDLPTPFLHLVAGSSGTPISSEWSQPIAAMVREHPLQCRRLRASLLSDRWLWKQVWAHRVLSRSEREQFDQLRLPETRQLEWLGARTAAKEAVQWLIKRNNGRDLELASIEIHPDAQGRPVVSGPWPADMRSVPVVSLAHTDGCAVAVAALGGQVGIDIERLGRRPDGFAGLAFSSDERVRLQELPADLLEEWTLRCWCAKEAVAKALGSGLRNPRDVRIAEIDLAQERIVVIVTGEIGRAYAGVAAVPLVTHSMREEDLIVATTLCPAAGQST